MSFSISKGSVLLCHKWSNSFNLPDDYHKAVLKDTVILIEDKLLQDPYKGTGGWTARARKLGIAGKMIGKYHPVWADSEVGYERFKYIESNYYIFDYEIEEDVDFFMVHKSYVREK
jgi:hypothetical protein